MYQDQTLTCRDCGKDFVWTASEQEFYASKGFSAPVRCPECRQKNKQAKQGGAGGGMSRGPRTMHEITCANCGAKGEVPFEPRDPSNVLCADCFRKKRDAERGGGSMDMGSTPAPTSSSDDSADTMPAADMTDNGDDAAATDESTDESAA
jgi:CxxC-x17-CxxC domain-containing protein